jgi:ribonucleoside-diphosphate reductase beta chain
MSNIFTTREHYKPFDYPWAFEYMVKQDQMHWSPTEVSLSRDIADWNTRLSVAEKNLLTHIFRFFTQADIDVAGGYVDKYLPVFVKPELRMMMLKFGAMEATHIWAYSLLIDTLGIPETEYKAFQEYEQMRDKHNYLSTIYTRDLEYAERYSPVYFRYTAKTLAVYSAFTEGLQLFSSFVMLLNFTRFGKMKGMGEIVTWSIRDESLHVEAMIKVFRTVVEENPRIWTDGFKRELYETCRSMVELEEKFIDLAFEMGGIEGLTKEEVKKFVHYIADRRLLQLGLKPNYGVKDNPLPWYDELLNSVEHTNFFEGRATEYAKGTYTGSLEKGYRVK